MVKKVNYKDIKDVPLTDALTRSLTPNNNYARSVRAGTIRGEQRINGTMIVNDESDDRVLIGIQENGFGDKNLGIKVSQEGIDVKDATDAQLVMSSAFNMFKIAYVIDESYEVQGADITGDGQFDLVYYHNLDITPICIGAFYNADQSLRGMLPYLLFQDSASYSGKPQSMTITIHDVDTTSVTIRTVLHDAYALSWVASNVNFNFRIYCQIETIP